MNKYIRHYFAVWGVITFSYHNYYNGLAKPHLKIGHGMCMVENFIVLSGFIQ